MGRKPRMVVPGGLYHVYNRVSSGEPVFREAEAAQALIELIRDVRQRDSWRVLAWCVMANHYHLVVRASEVPLWRGLHRVQNVFSRRYNRRRERSGPLWQSRYHAKLIEDERHLAQVILYVHLNPVRAGIEEEGGHYKFSGHGEILRKTRWDVLDVDQTLLCFGEKRSAALRRYRAAFSAGLSTHAEKRKAKDKSAAQAAEEDLWYDVSVAYVDALGRSTAAERPRIQAEDLVAEACGLLHVPPELLASHTRNRKIARERRLVVLLAVERWGLKNSDLAGAFGRTTDVISWMVGRSVKERQEDAAFRKKMDELDLRLVESLTENRDRGAPE